LVAAVRVVIDRSRCVGAGQCVASAPRVFDQDDQGLSFLLQEGVPPDLTAGVRTAARLCPSGAIAIVED
jgi:ferredoxin